jgi:S-adenosylmethionine:tRNA ribosyltransferase-isomerase
MGTTGFDFYLPSELNATHPPERRGLRRDYVQMMVLDKVTGQIKHERFSDLADHLHAGDLVVLNNSRTIPAILKASWQRSGTILKDDVEVRLARRRGESLWDVLAVEASLEVGDTLHFSKELTASVKGESTTNATLKALVFSLSGVELLQHIYSLGEPVRYEYIHHPWDLDYYQTVFASTPGSVEMPSAGRAFSWELLFNLKKKGVQVDFIQLHTGLSYLLDDNDEHSPKDNHEEYSINAATMKKICKTKASGGRVIAVGTTVVRALETAARTGALAGWTNLYIQKGYPLQLVDGIITGFHEPKASHLDMLTAFIEEKHLFKAYRKAIDHQYLWHEFGDMNLIV